MFQFKISLWWKKVYWKFLHECSATIILRNSLPFVDLWMKRKIFSIHRRHIVTYSFPPFPFMLRMLLDWKSNRTSNGFFFIVTLHHTLRFFFKCENRNCWNYWNWISFWCGYWQNFTFNFAMNKKGNCMSSVTQWIFK